MCHLTSSETSPSSTNSSREVLPSTVKPIHYDVILTPKLSDDFIFQGEVNVNLLVKESTNVIVANAKELTVLSGSVTSPSLGTLKATQVTQNESAETVSFTFEKSLPVGETVTLHSTFTGTHNDKMAGFYRSGYTDKDGNKKHLVVTQFEATDCRRAFVSWDEPNLKATFDVTLRVPVTLNALSNMPETESKEVTVNDVTFKQVKFARTPIMSTYLVALAVGEFEYIEEFAKPKSPADAKPIQVRVYTLPGQKEMGRFGLNVAVKTLEFFSEYFDIAYPLPKMDMIAIPDFGAGAMENWGLVTYREIYLLYDEKSSGARAKQNVAYVVGHELAHQWFGNLVTMDWWSELWLNEGFATFVGWLAVDHIFPEWNVWTQFVTNDFTSGLNLDALRSSHPIEVDVKSPAEINQIFDAISYSKGASLIRMLNSFLGGDKFMQGVRQYLKDHKYGNATTTKLWDALSASSGTPVADLMTSWTREMGYPVISVQDEKYDAASGTLSLTLKQSRYLSSGDLTAEEDKNGTVWMVPISVQTHLSKTPTQCRLDGKTGVISFPYKQDEGAFFKLNHSTTGFFRVQYQRNQINNIASALTRDLDTFTTEDRIGLLSDVFALARAGLGRTSEALALAQSFTKEENYMVLDELSARLGSVLSAWFTQPAAVVDGIKALQRGIFSTKVSTVGYDYPEKENLLDALKRTLIIGAAAEADDKVVLGELRKRFKDFRAGNKDALHPNLRSVAFVAALKDTESPLDVFNDVVDVYKTAPIVDQRLAALGSVGATSSVEVVQKILEMILDPNVVKPQDVHYPVTSLSKRSPIKTQVNDVMWNWLQANWDTLHERFAASLSLLGRVLSCCTEEHQGEDFAKEVERWAAGEGLSDELKAKRAKQLEVAKRPLAQSLEKIRAVTNWVARDGDDIKGFLESVKV